MVPLDQFGRPHPPEQSREIETLLGFLEFHRATFEWKCRDLDAVALASSIPSSEMTLGGMMKHLALVEEHWFSKRLFDREPTSPWNGVDWDADADWDWHSAKNDSPDELRSLWQRCVQQSRDNVREALAHGDLDQLARNELPGDQPNLRWIIVHMIEEYARHNGHADILRESIDHSTGE